MKPTVEYILKSFRDSGKRHLLLTGARGCGKTTRFNELAQELVGEYIPGITTYAVPRSHVVLRENLTGNEAVIGHFDGVTMQPVGGFTDLGIPALERALRSESAWVGIDELGYLESSYEGFQRAVLRVFDTKRVLAVVRKQSTSFLDMICNRQDVFVMDLDECRMKIGCVIMASGLSKRFGSNKLLAEFRGKTFIERTIDVTEGGGDRRVVVTRSEAVAEICRERNVDVILHTFPGRNDMVRLGTEYLSDMDGIVFCPCDQPLLGRESLQRLLHYPQLHDETILRLAWNDEPGLPILFMKSYFDELSNLPEKMGGGYLARKYPDRVVHVPVENSWELKDVDTPEDLQTLYLLYN